MILYDGGLKLTSAGLAVDFRHRQPLGFVSHAHGDHLARHELAWCTPDTAELYWLRLGRRPVRRMPYGEPARLGDTTLTALPAGHMLGSAMLLAESAEGRLLYTGDFQLRPARTSQPVDRLPSADILVMESTFGAPRWVLPPREQAEQQLLDLVAEALSLGRAPVVFAYAAGKAQEVTALLTEAGCRVLVHPKIAAVNRVYERCGVPLGPYGAYAPQEAGPEAAAVILPPRHHRGGFLPCPPRCVKLAVTGWALDARTRHRLDVDHAVPLSDHADYQQLIECVRQVDPQLVFCTHGPPSFVDHLRELGFNAHVLDDRAAARCSGAGAR